MIVGTYFDADNDTTTAIAWIQHDVYWDALRIIVGACRDHVKSALLLLDQKWPKEWETDFSYDHRTLQVAHDFIAAAWRYREPKMPLFLQVTDKDLIASEWLSWLRREVDLWSDQPNIVRNIMTILGNQNVDVGYRAEDCLARALLLRYADVPWKQSWRSLAETSSQSELPLTEKPHATAPAPKTANWNADECECVARRRPPCGQIPCKTLCERANREGWGPLE